MANRKRRSSPQNDKDNRLYGLPYTSHSEENEANEGRNLVLRAHGLCKSYGSGTGRVDALRNVDLCVYQGELLVVLGSSGSGKSTLLNLIGGIDVPDRGELWVDGVNICKLKDRGLTAYRRNEIGFVFQFFNLLSDLTAEENIALIADFSGKRAETGRVMEMMGLSQRRKHYPSQLSGGEQQRVAIARALVKQARLLLCDEPTGALDDKTGKQILNVLEQLVRIHGQTAIVVTHTKEIARMADRVVQMRDGAIEREWRNETPVSAEEITW